MILKMDATPGFAICVFARGRVADLDYIGTRCHVGGPLDESTVWEAASLTKPVIARHVLRLAAGGEIDLDEPLAVDLAAVRAAADHRWKAVTMLRVLTHTSGLPNWRGPAESLRAGGCDEAAGTEVLRFEREPGSFGYSGEGFEVLLHALSRRADRAPAELLDGLLRQFGMADSSFVWRAAFEGKAAIPHGKNGDALAKRRPLTARAAGSLHTTVADYVAFSLAVLTEGADEVFRPCVLLDEVRGRSVGWGTVSTPHGIVAWQHGDNAGFKHLVALRRDQGDGVLIFTNGDAGRELCREVAGLTLGAALW